jgi:hypothetical protein
MKTFVRKNFAGSAIRLAVLSVLLLGMAGVCMAQASAAPARPAAPAAAAPQAQPVAQPAQAAPPSKPAPKGTHEGITVHGHWTIEVRNPDGKVVSHTEFENSLAPDGSVNLTSLLLGNFVPGGYEVTLYNASASSAYLSGPCQGINNPQNTGCVLIGSLISPTPGSFSDQINNCGSTNIIAATGPCFPLTITPASDTGLLVFKGTAVAASTTPPITDVVLAPLTCPSFGGLTSAINTVSPSTCAQGQTAAWSYLTHATLQTPVTITTVGQFIAVTVQISFQ